jgi:alkyl hydroperoxide reductase subunit AhpF
MPILEQDDRKEIGKLLSDNLGGEVTLKYFRGSALESSPEVRDIAEQTNQLFAELAAIDSRIKVSEVSVNEAPALGFTSGPAFTVEGKAKGKVRYLGAPAGGEFSAFLADIVDVSKGTTRLAEATRAALSKIDKPIHIRVFVTPT